MKKRILSALMALAMALTLLPASVLGAGAEPGEAEVTWTAGSSPDDGTGSDELLMGYLYQEALGGSGITTYADHSSLLSSSAKTAYSKLKTEVAKVASGSLASTKFNVGVTLSEDERKALMTVLMTDCPYDLYWYDKTAGYVTSTDGTISLAVAKAYATSTTEEVTFSDGRKGTYHFEADTSKTRATTTAVNNAKAIVSRNTGKSDFERLTAYKDEICKLVAYNDSAAGNENTPYGDPWQLIYVFDGNSGTNVVCEGYAKAFQYLCDLDGGLNCYTVNGVMAGGTGAGGHMWNIVTLDGKNYLVDVTNCDSGTVGYPDKLFMAGATGSVSDGYTASSVKYTYDDDIIDIYGSSVLTLSNSDYTPSEEGVPASFRLYDSDRNQVTKDNTADNPVLMAAGTSQTFTLTLCDLEGHELILQDHTITGGFRAGSVFSFTGTKQGERAMSITVTVPANAPVGSTDVLTFRTPIDDETVLGSDIHFKVAEGGSTPVEKHDTRIVVDPTPINVTVGGKVTFTARLADAADPSGNIDAIIKVANNNALVCDVVRSKNCTPTTPTEFTVTGLKGGTAMLTLLFEGNENFNSTTTTTTVTVGTSSKQPVAKVAITGDAVFEGTLTASVTDQKGDAGTLSYQWLRNGTTEIGTNAATYTVTANDIGQQITVVVSGAGDKYAPATSNAVTPTAIQAAATLTLTPSTIKIGATATAAVVVKTTDGTVIAEYDEVVYTSSDTKVATVSGSTITAASALTGDSGKTTITAKVTKTGYEIADGTAELTVVNKTPMEIVVTPVGGKTYGDAAFTLQVSVKGEDDADITENTDLAYTAGANGVVQVSNGTVTIHKAGAAEITVKATPKAAIAGDYSESEETVTFTVAKKTISIATVAVQDKTFDGTTAATVANVTFSGVKDGDTVEYTASAAFGDANVGTGKTVTVTVSLDNNNYQLASDTATDTADITAISAANQTVSAVVSTNTEAAPVVIDLTQYLPANCGGTPTYTGAAVTDGKLTLAPKADGTAETITITVSGMTNYSDFTITVDVTYTGKTLVEFNITLPSDLTFSSSPKAATVTGAPAGVVPEVRYTGTSAAGVPYDSTTAPTNAGSYKVTASVPSGNETYAGVAEKTFEITPAQVTVKADDKNIIVGQPLPGYTYTPATVDGVNVACPSAADSTLVGSYPIRISGPAKSDDGNYVYTYVGGTLYVSAVSAPTASPRGGNYTGGQTIRLTADSGATIYYTLDGTTPTINSTRYTSTISLPNTTKTTTIKAIAVEGSATSGVMTEVYNITASSRPSGGGGSSSGGGGSSTPANPSVTVPVSGDQTSIRVDATVSGSTATVTEIDTRKIGDVIGDDVRTGMVEIDFSGLSNTISAVRLPTDAIGEIADAAKSSRNDVDGLTVKLSTGEISFDGTALASIESQAGSSVTLTMAQARSSDLNARQREKVGSAPVYNLTLTSGSRNITRFNNGLITVSLPYTLKAGEDASRITVYYLDDNGNIQACETMYNMRTKSVIFTTTHLSLYYIGIADAAIVVENIPASGMAQASTQTVEVDGQKVEFQMYALLNADGNATNYIKLRDLAHVLNGTKAPFSIGYSAETGITIVTGQPYQDNGSEMKTPFSGARAYTGGAQSVQINGKSVAMTAINLLDDNGGGYNYFKLRDLGIALGFNVSWSDQRGIFVETDKPYVG